METFLWGVFPYIVALVFFGGLFWRYRYDQFGWTTRSSQLYESRLLKFASPLFHFALLAVFMGHVVGLIIPKAFTDWDGIDQISRLIRGLREDPDSRRHIVSSWNVGELDQMALNPCHGLVIQFYVSGSRLDLQMYQRSGDLFLGVPFNIASYSLLLHMVAQQVGMLPGRFVWVCGDTHIYSNHVEQVREQVSRTVLPFGTLHLRKADDIFSYRPEYVVVDGYAHHPAIRAEVAV